MILVQPTEISVGLHSLRFAFSREVNDAIKIVPGVRWDGPSKRWLSPTHALPAVAAELQQRGIGKLTAPTWLERVRPRMGGPVSLLRPYQYAGLEQALLYGDFLLSMEQRTGKSPLAMCWAATLAAPTTLIIYPSLATDEWQRQWAKFEMAFPLAAVEGVGGLNPAFVEAARGLPQLALGISYELLRVENGQASQTVRDLQALLAARGRYNVIADEIQLVADRKAPRTKLFVELGRNAERRLALSGTPMRNNPANLFLPLDWLWPGEWGSWSKFSRRYCDGQMGDYGWVAKGVTNPEELQARLKVCSLRVTRAEVAPWLPKTERRVFSVSLKGDTKARYAGAEQQAVGEISAALKGSGPAKVFEELALITAPDKFELLAQRIRAHDGKIVVGALHHEVLFAAWNFLQEKFGGKPDAPVPWLFIAPGWASRAQREAGMAAWKAAQQLPGQPHPTLLVNTLSSGVAIDLSDAVATVGIEACWVPSDLLQFESRIHTVTPRPDKPPPLHEYLLARDTVDEDMTTRLLQKLEATAKVIGRDAETLGAHQALAGAGVTDRGLVGLVSHDDDTVFSVIARMRSRVGGGAAPIETSDNREDASQTDVLDNEEETADE